MAVIVRLLVGLLAASLACAANAVTFTVINTNDSGAGSLRDAITAANALAGPDDIAFNIPGAGVHTITPASLLPAITDPVTINGYTQPGTSPNTNPLGGGINAVLLIELNASNAGNLRIQANGTVVRGLVVNRGVDNIDVEADNVTIAGNFLGTNPAGLAAQPNAIGGFGIRHDNGNNLTIGGPAPADRNLISGNSQGGIILGFVTPPSGHVIQGNYIGPDATGTTSLSPSAFSTGLFNVNNADVIGNLISGNQGGGLHTINVVPGAVMAFQGNLIGTQANGTGALGNGNFGGIDLSTPNARIGGTLAGQANTIAFNSGFGIAISAFGTNDNIRISRNSIHSNTLLGISLGGNAAPRPNDLGDPDTGPNNGQNYPVITSAVVAAGNVTISGTLNSVPNTDFDIEFFANSACDASGNGEGQTYIGTTTVSIGGSGNASFGPLVFPVPVGQSVITSTATDEPSASTSEFSACPVGAPGATTTALTSLLNPSLQGQAVTFTATVTGAGPTGTVQFLDGITVLGTVALAVNTAALTTSSLAVGTHPITAVYSGDANNLTSTSPVLNQVVNPIVLNPTTTALVSSLNPSLVGQSVTFTATVNSGAFVASGTVEFRDGATLLATVALVGNSAAFTTSALAAGVHPITAAYSGDVETAPSTSPVLNQLVSPVGGPAPSPPADIPTLSEWMLMLMATLVAMLGLHQVRGRRK